MCRSFPKLSGRIKVKDFMIVLKSKAVFPHEGSLGSQIASADVKVTFFAVYPWSVHIRICAGFL